MYTKTNAHLQIYQCLLKDPKGPDAKSMVEPPFRQFETRGEGMQIVSYIPLVETPEGN